MRLTASISRFGAEWISVSREIVAPTEADATEHCVSVIGQRLCAGIWIDSGDACGTHQVNFECTVTVIRDSLGRRFLINACIAKKNSRQPFYFLQIVSGLAYSLFPLQTYMHLVIFPQSKAPQKSEVLLDG
jgi:hypothetical protein